MQKTGYSVLLIALLACLLVLSCTPQLTPAQKALFSATPSASVKIAFAGSSSKALELLASSGSMSARDTGPSSGLGLSFGIAGGQSGALTAGNSQDTSGGLTVGKTVAFNVFTSPDGGTTVYGANHSMERFTTASPDVLLPAGMASGLGLGWSSMGGLDKGPGVFMMRFSPTASTQLVVVQGDNPAKLTTVDEVVLRTYACDLPFNAAGDIYGSNYETGGTLVCHPHFFYDDGTGTKAYACDIDQFTSTKAGNLRVNGSSSAFTHFEYVLFLPASVVGTGFNHFVEGSEASPSVADPVLGDEKTYNGSTGSYVNPPSKWTLDPDWITDETGNAGLFAMIDLITGTTDHTSTAWKGKATYFQNLFAKFYRAGSTMFDLGYTWSFQVIALPSSLDISRGAGLSVTWNGSGATFSKNGEVLEFASSPTLEFSAEVSAQ